MPDLFLHTGFYTPLDPRTARLELVRDFIAIFRCGPEISKIFRLWKQIILKSFEGNGQTITMRPKYSGYEDLIGNVYNVLPAGDTNYINILYSFDESEVDVNECSCQELYISGFQNQALNGRYIKQQTIFKKRKKLFN